MKYFLYLVITLYTFIFLGIFNSSILKAHEFNYNAKNFSDYFSGLSSFSDLDYKNSKEVFSYFLKLKEKNKIVLIATHNRELAKKADYTLSLGNGNIKRVNA